MTTFCVLIPSSRPHTVAPITERLLMNMWCRVLPFFLDTLAPADVDPAYWKLNREMDRRRHWYLGDTWFHFLCDDDMVSPGFYDSLRRCDNEKINVHHVPMLRGHRTPPGGRHECSTLTAEPENRVTGKIGLEQFIVRASVMQDRRFEEALSPGGMQDGHMAESLARDVPGWSYHRGESAPAVWFNYFEPGRWDK
jgi:hypothetical protein